MSGELARRTLELLREIGKLHYVGKLKGHIFKDHVHMFLLVSTHRSVGKLVQLLTGKISRKSTSGFKRFRGSFMIVIHRAVPIS